MSLTTGQDVSGVLVGSAGTTSTAGNDTFFATNTTLQAGDSVNGGAGADTLFYTDASAAGVNLVATALSSIENLYVQNVAGTTTAGAKETVTLTFNAVTTASSSGAVTIAFAGTTVTVAAAAATASAVQVATAVANSTFTGYVVKSIDGAAVVLEATTVGNLANITPVVSLGTGGAMAIPTVAIVNGIATVTTAVTQTVDATTLTDTVQFWNNASTGAVTFDGIQQAATIGVKGVTAGANATTTANFATAMTKGTADSVSIALDGNTSAGTITIGAGFETVNVSAAGKNTVAELETGAKTVNITGAGDLTITATVADATKIDGSAATGKLTLTSAVAKVDIDTGTGADKVTLGHAASANHELSVSTGAGNDTVVIASLAAAAELVDNKVTIDGGAGTDTLEINGALAASLSGLTAANFAKKGIVNFEKLAISNQLVDTSTVNVERLGLNTDITLKAGLLVTEVATLSNVANGGKVTLASASAGALTIAVKDAATAGNNSDVLNVAFAGAHDAATITTFSVIAANVETVNLVSSTSKATPLVTADTNTLTTLTTVGAEAINISGDVAFIITDALGASFTALKSINASENTAGVTLSADNVVQGVSITGTAKADTITGGDGNDIINAGAGNDLVIGSTGSDVITLGAGTDTFRFVAGNAGDTIKDFTAGAGGDILDYNEAVDGIGAASATAIVFQAVDALGVAFVAGSTVIAVTGAAAAGATTAQIATFLDNYGNNHTFESADDLLFAVNLGNGNTGIVRFNSGGADNTVTAAELTLLVTLEGVNTSALTADNFI